MTTVRVTAEDIAAGKGGDCFRRPVALALARATGDDEANIYERDWELWVGIWGRSILAPHEVRSFIREFDARPRTEDGRLDVGHKDYMAPEPFEFELPDLGDPEWQERCYRCEELFDVSELDDEGVCKACREGGADA